MEQTHPGDCPFRSHTGENIRNSHGHLADGLEVSAEVV